MTAIEPFRIQATADQLQDLQRRLRATRWPDAETTDDWHQGVPLAYAQALCRYWAAQYDWPAREAKLNLAPQYRTQIEDLQIHFIHLPSPRPDAVPLLMTHGWPGSIVEFQKVLGPLSDPDAHRAPGAPAFHLVCPSLPGYGFSDKPRRPGTSVERIATLWDTLMLRLGYARYFAQGGDWGSAVTTAIAAANRGQCAGIHVNMPNVSAPRSAREHPDAADAHALRRARAYQDWDSGYSKLQATRPQTVGYGLADSPAAQAQWIIEKFWRWTDCDGHPENVLTRDELLDNVMVYWLSNSGASSARLYWESFGRAGSGPSEIDLPTGCSIFPQEIVPTPRSWAERRYRNIVYWNELDRGGHFAAFEQPALFVEEMRACFARMELWK